MADDDKAGGFISGSEDTELPDSERGAPGRRMHLVEPGDRLGRYQLDDELGEGGMATVFRARDLELRRDVAVKVLFAHLAKKPEVVARFQREARAAAALDHPHVLKVFDVGGAEAKSESRHRLPPYIVLELVRGPSLGDFIGAEAMLAEVVAAVGVVLCSALQCAHDAGIIHRDLKPDNVLVAEEGRLVLGDFGVAHAEDDSLVTKTGAILGTPAFMSPEQAVGDELTAQSDLYSLGATLYRLATGHRPYSGSTAKIVAAIVQGDRVPAERRCPAVGPELGAIIEKLMARDPSARYPSAAAAEAALLEVVGGVGEDVEELLQEYFSGPSETEDRLAPVAARASLDKALEAHRSGARPRALALANRVLELDPDCEEALALMRSAGSSRPKWPLWGAALLALAGVGAFGVSQFGAADSPIVAPESVDAGNTVVAKVALDAAVPTADASMLPAIDAGTAAAATSKKSTRVRVTSRKEERSTPVDAGAVAARPDAAVKAAVVAKPEVLGTLRVRADTWCELSIDGTSRGRQLQAARRFELAPGSHRVRCSQGRGRPTAAKEVVVESGRDSEVDLRLLHVVEVRVAVTRGRSLRIGKHLASPGDRLSLAPGRYRVTTLDGKGQSVSTGWATVAARSTCVLRDRPQLGCYKR